MGVQSGGSEKSDDGNERGLQGLGSSYFGSIWPMAEIRAWMRSRSSCSAARARLSETRSSLRSSVARRVTVSLVAATASLVAAILKVSSLIWCWVSRQSWRYSSRSLRRSSAQPAMMCSIRSMGASAVMHLYCKSAGGWGLEDLWGPWGPGLLALVFQSGDAGGGVAVEGVGPAVEAHELCLDAAEGFRHAVHVAFGGLGADEDFGAEVGEVGGHGLDGALLDGGHGFHGALLLPGVGRRRYPCGGGWGGMPMRAVSWRTLGGAGFLGRGAGFFGEPVDCGCRAKAGGLPRDFVSI
ncbi:hypothetical protein SBA4_3910004 [Candidatus Sulfopaludibacter sp. SbA4]|nr:hypothetical protein SBA4_3910004 [Candidatus Sulfopaludibacter sp. SbA4]